MVCKRRNSSVIADNVRFGNAPASTEVVEHALGVACQRVCTNERRRLDYSIEQMVVLYPVGKNDDDCTCDC